MLAVARLAAQKGLDTLIEAAGRLAGPRTGAGGRVRWDRAAARATRPAPRGRPGSRCGSSGTATTCPALLAAADVVVLPSVWEGQPLILQEVLRAGRPLVASRVGGVADLTGEDAALLVPPGDAAALSAAVLSVLDDPDLAARLGEAAVKRAAALPSEDAALDAALAAYLTG